MDLGDVMDEAAEVLDGLPALAGRSHAYPKESIKAPAALMSYPEAIVFDSAMASGLDEMDPSIVVLVGRIHAKATRDQAAQFTARVGPNSVKAAIEAHAWSSCDSVRVRKASFDTYRLDETEYLAIVFLPHIVGSGTI